RKPRSWTSTQTVRPNAIPNHIAHLTSRGRPVRKATAIAASAITTTRLTANPSLLANEAKCASSADRTCGCGVPDISRTIPDRVPGLPLTVPRQKPRPGQAWSTAIPAKNTPSPASSSRPNRGPRQARSGSAISAPAAPVSQLWPGAKMPPNDSPNTHTTRPQATLATPASLDQVPRAATRSQAPMPSWIQTLAAAAWTGWYDQAVPPQLTTCWTQAG